MSDMAATVVLPVLGKRTLTPRVTESDFCTWLSGAVAGDIFPYHAGFLAGDVNRAVSALGDAERADLTHLAQSVMWAAEERLVHLLQRREGPDHFTYLAIARRRSGAPTPLTRSDFS